MQTVVLRRFQLGSARVFILHEFKSISLRKVDFWCFQYFLQKMNDSISTRCAKLNQIFAGKNVGRKSSPNGAGFTREALLDAFLVLFEECSSEFMLKDKNISEFVKKCKYKELIGHRNHLISTTCMVQGKVSRLIWSADRLR